MLSLNAADPPKTGVIKRTTKKPVAAEIANEVFIVFTSLTIHKTVNE
jgi:hypothetical protein